MKMPSSGEKKSPVPLKNMDIKSAFLAAGSRKRKALSPTVPKSQSKSLKLADDKTGDIIDIVEIVDDDEISAECKENTDLNTTDSQNILQANRKISSEDLDSEDKKVCSEKETNKNSSNESMDEDFASSNELNSSNLNNSVNVSELSENIESQNKTESDLNTSIDCNRLASSESKSKNSLETDQADSKPKKKKKKMTPEEAKARATEREQKHKEKLLKKEELEAQKKQKKEEIEKRRLQKEQEKREKEEEKKEKERIRLEKKEQEEKERLQKLKEKEELKKQRQLMLEQKQEEKKKKEEMRLKREEEKKKAEEEKRQAELEKEQKEKEKQEKAKAAFFKFFKKSTPTTPAPQPTETEGAFKPFQVSEDMTLAPVVPAAAQERFDKEKLDRALQQQNEKKLYLDILKSGSYKDVRQRNKAKLRQQSLSDSDVLVLDKKAADELFLTAKLLQFNENVRPPYWGTWRKKSKVVGPRRPFGQDNIFDYEVDSDDEWDEGGPGESLSGTENEVESEDDYEVDNEFFVPHGYLSPEEEKEDDEEVVNDPEKQKAILKQKQQEFESERKKKTTELKPIILGCFFENVPELQDNGLRSFFLTYGAEILYETAIPTCFTVKKLQAESAPSSTANSPTSGNLIKKKNPVPEEAMPHLIRLLHGNTNSRETLIKEFQSFWQQSCQTASNSEKTSPEKVEAVSELTERKTPTHTSEMTPETPATDPKNISKRQLNLTIKKISTYGKCPNPAQKKSCWWVQDEIREKYRLLDAPIPNEWVMSSAPANDTESSSNVKNVASIKEFLMP